MGKMEGFFDCMVLLMFSLFLFTAFFLWKLEWDWILEHSERLRNLFLIVAGVVGAVFIYWRTSIAKTEAETRKIDAETRKQDSETNKDNSINNMYTIAIEQLGKEHGENRPNLEVRIGALYSLEKLAQANPDYRQSIMDVLCSYVRNNAPLPKDREKPEESEYANQNKDKPRTDIQTALTIIGRSNTEFAEQRQPIDLSNCYLVEADLADADLAGADLVDAYLVGAYLEGANLADADLEDAYLTGAYLVDAYLRDAYLVDAYLQGAELQEANLQGANLQGANLEGANLRACRNLTCEQLRSARNWQQAKHGLDCGAAIPDPKGKAEAEQTDSDA